MKLKITASAEADGSQFGGSQVLPADCGEYVLDEIFKLNFFRIIIDELIGDALCFRLMEGAHAHYYVLEGAGDKAVFERETPAESDYFTFELLPD